MFVRSMFSNIHDFADFPIVFALRRPLQSLTLALGQSDLFVLGCQFLRKAIARPMA